MSVEPSLRDPAASRPAGPTATAGATAVEPAEQSGSSGRAGMFAALAVPNYRIWVGGAFVSNVGTWMQRVAQDWLVLELSGGSALAVGVTTALQFLPMLLLSAYAGLVADRLDKRQILLLTQTWLALCAAALGLLAVTGVAATWHVYVLALLFGVGTAFDHPARQTFVAEIVGPDHLPNAIALNSATFHAARIVGPAVAGLVIAAVGSGWAILGNGLSYLAFLAGLLLLRRTDLRPTPRAERGRRQIREGLAYVVRSGPVLTTMLVVFFVGTFGMNFQMTSALMTSQEFGLGAEAYGILGTIMAVGSLAGALLAARRTRPPRLRYLVGMATAFGLLEVVAGLMPGYSSYAATLPFMGLAAILTLTGANAALQLGVEPHLRGRVMALYAMVLMGGTPVGAPLLGWVGEVFGPRWTLIGGGGLVVLGVLASAAYALRRERLRLRVTLVPTT